MTINATAMNRKADLHDSCGKLALKADSGWEAALLAKLIRVMSFGGRLTIERPGHEPYVAEFGDGLAARKGKGDPASA